MNLRALCDVTEQFFVSLQTQGLPQKCFPSGCPIPLFPTVTPWTSREVRDRIISFGWTPADQTLLLERCQKAQVLYFGWITWDVPKLHWAFCSKHLEIFKTQEKPPTSKQPQNLGSPNAYLPPYLVLRTDGTWSLDFEPDSDVTIDILPTLSPTSGKAQRLILSTCLKPIEVKQIFRYRCGKYVYGCCWTRALNALTVCHLMLLANNMLHFGSAKNNNKIVVLQCSCHNWMTLCCDSAQFHEPGNTTYILKVSPWFPDVFKSLGLKAFRDGIF